MNATTGLRDEPAVITVIHGRPTSAELAAALTVLLTASATPSREGVCSSHWADRSLMLTALPRPGRSSWRVPALPH